MPKVSVILPIYNMEPYLRECLDSVLGQTLEDMEIICVNDGSTDSSAKIIEGFCGRDKRLVYIDQENMGAAGAKNTGLEAACGEFACFLDPDDLYPDTGVLEGLYEAAKRSNARICGGSWSNFDGGTGIVNTSFEGKDWGYVYKEDRMWDYKDYQFDYGFQRFIYDRQMLADAGIRFPPYIRFEDPQFFVRAMIEARRFYALSRVTYRYRIAHKEVKWNGSTVASVLAGVTDNLAISKAHGLTDLHALTLRRLETVDIYIVKELKGEQASEIESLLRRMDECTDQNMLRRSSFWIDNIKTARDYLGEARPATAKEGRLSAFRGLFRRAR